MKDPKRILFVSHDASRSGAPIILLNVIRWIRQYHPHIGCDVLLLAEGPLVGDFRSIARCFIWHPNILASLLARGIWGKRRFSMLNPLNRLRMHPWLIRAEYDLIYANTLATCPVIPTLHHLYRCPILCHVHEMPFIADEVCPEPIRGLVLNLVSRYIAVSTPVESLLLDGFNIPPTAVAKVPEFFTIPAEANRLSKEATRKSLGLAQDEFVVCGAGTINWRKGADLFVMIAGLVRARLGNTKVRFVWIGGQDNADFFKKIAHEIRMLGLNDVIMFPGSVPDPHKYFVASDVLALTSREDPFPLVALEAGAFGLPVVCFEGAVGSTDFVDHSSGAVVAYPDLGAFAGAIASFHTDRGRRKEASRVITSVVQRYDRDQVVPYLWAEIATMLDGTG